ncbi:MAG: branched-chain amino acid ABC transporter permease [Candidatus Tectomicrobia bacterium]
MLYGQILINSILLGGIYACIAVGFSLVWGVMNILNILHGTFLMLGGYVTFWLFTLYGIDPFIAMPLAAALMFGLGYTIQRLLINLVIKAPMFITLILTFGLELFAVNMAIYFWTGDYRSVQTAYAGWAFHVGELVVPFIRLALFTLGLLMTAALFWFLARTRTGRAIRATRMDLEAAQLMGVNIGKIYAVTFGLGAALAGAAGALISAGFAISPVVDVEFLAKSFVICTIGGLGNMTGALAGGLILALVENFGALYFGPGYQNALGYAALILVLFVRPAGLLGKEGFA